jgi:hypothetical protein
MPILEKAAHADLRGAHLYDIAGDFQPSRDEEKTLATLKPADRAVYDVPRCMDGTRETVLRKIDSWLDDFGTPNSVIL